VRSTTTNRTERRVHTANTNDDEIIYQYGASDPTDYQVEDMLVCIAAGHGLQKGELWTAREANRGQNEREREEGDRESAAEQ
jgi:hypothetical protein